MELEQSIKNMNSSDQKEQEQPDSIINLTIEPGSSNYANGKHTSTKWKFNLREMGIRWITGSVLLKIKLGDEDLAAKEIERMYRNELFHLFVEHKVMA